MVDPVYRAAMNDLTFGDLPRVNVDLFDLEQATFTRTDELEARYGDRGEVWHVIGTDIIAGGRRGESFIHQHWKDGPALWKRLNFAVVSRPGSEVEPADLPPRAKLFRMSCEGSSETIRRRAYQKESLTDLVVPEAERYIKRYDLYRGKAPAKFAGSANSRRAR